MRALKVILLTFLLNFSENCLVKSSRNYELMEIIEEIIRSKELNKISYVNLLTAEDFLRDFKNKELMTDLIKRLSGSKAVINMNKKAMKRLSKQRILLTVMFLQSIEDFEEIILSMTDDRFNYGGYYVILFEKANFQDAQKIFKVLWDFYIHNVNLIRFINESFAIETYFPYNHFHCNKTYPEEIARYQHGKFIIKPKEFFPKKFKNFHKCTLNLVTFQSLAPSILKRNFKNGSFELYGRDIEVMKMLEQELNFRGNITFLHEYGSWGVLYPNGTTTGAMGRAKRRESDMAWGNLNLKHDRTLIMGFSFGYYLETLIFVIPKGEPYSPFAKLIRPFDNFVWIALLLIILICILIIVILSFQPIKIRNFVYGERIHNPVMNVLIAIYGGSQRALPSFTFARSLLMMFLLFCLVLRSLYQGSLYQFLQANDNQPEVSSINEMSENEFKFYLIPSYDDMTKDNVAMKNKRVIIQPSDIKTIMDNTLTDGYKGSLLVAISEVLYKNKLKAPHHEQLYTICKQPFTMIPISIYYPKNSYLVEPVDDKLFWYQCSGLMSYWASHEMDYKYLSYKTDSKGPKEMSLDHLSGTFQIWLFACILSCIIFVIEIFWKWGHKKTRRSRRIGKASFFKIRMSY